MVVKNIKFTKISIFLVLLCVCVSHPAKSQVTIGSDLNPLKGVLLDLKEFEETQGNANSAKGMILPRVFLTDPNELFPILTGSETGYENLKTSYTGLTVYNVNPNFLLDKGLYIWDGAQWHKSINAVISAKNGLTVVNSNTIRLGGDLEENTTLNLNDNNLIFDRNSGKIGIGTSDPKAILHIENPSFDDPLILENLKFVSDAHNEIDGSASAPAPTYYDLMISENGVVRKAHPLIIDPNQSVLYSLSTDTDIAPGDATGGGTSGGGGSMLSWNGPGSTNSQIVKLPEDGAYVFSFSLNGTWTLGSAGTTVDANTFYISAFLNGTDPASNLMDIAEMVAYHTAYNAMSYSINLTLMGKAGDEVRFKVAVYYPDRNAFTWRLLKDKTNMIFWRL